MPILPDKVWKHFEDGKQVIHHTPGIWSDMAIETTYMRYDHGDDGITRVTLNDECVKMWTYGTNIFFAIVQNLDEMRDVIPASALLHHKEEGMGHIKSDAKDRLALREELELCIYPLDPKQHPEDVLVNIVAGEVVSHPSVNVD